MKEDLKINDREVAFDIIYRVIYDDGYSNLLLKNTQLDSRPFVTDLVYGVVERKFTLEEMLKILSNKDLEKIDQKVVVLIYIGLYQLFYSNTKDYAAIFEVVELAKKMLNKGAAGFINGILRSAQRMGDDLLNKVYGKGWEYEYSINNELLSMIKENKANTLEILKATFIPPKVHIYVRKNMAKIKSRLESNEIKFKEKEDFLIIQNYRHSVLTNFFRNGDYTIMDYSTSAVRELAPDNNFETIFDMCAAPGGKTLLLADKFPNAKIKASDINKNRVTLLENNIRRWGLTNVTCGVHDARNFDGNEYDLVLCDVLCSGSGVISRKPELKYKINYKMIEELNVKQIEILKNAVNQTKKDKYIIYSTCSILKRENRDIVDRVAGENNLSIIKDTTVFPSKDSEGFYACLLKKI